MQTKALADTCFELFVGGSKGPGKSDLVLFKPLQQVQHEKFKALILRSTYGELQELMDRSQRYFPRLKNPPHWDGENKRWVWSNRAILRFGYCEQRVDVQRYQGQEWGYIGYDELGNQPDEKVWIDLSAECRCPNPDVIPMMCGSGNPGFAGHMWTKRRFITPCGKNGERIHRYPVDLPTGKRVWLTRRFIPGRVFENPIYANNAIYMAQLASMPEVKRKQLLYGDYDAGTGSALDELDETIHLCRPFSVPAHWPIYAAFDWGYAHWWVFMWAAVTEDGKVYVIDTIKGRREKPWQIVEKIKRRAPLGAIQRIDAGHDVRANEQAKGQDNPSLQETFLAYGIPLSLANIDRRQGLQQMREYVKWRGCGPDGSDEDPQVQFMDTPGNRWLVAQLQDMIVDPDDVEVILKVDADPETGEGGDDGADCFRYLMMGRPARAQYQPELEQLRAWDPVALAYEARVQRTVHIDAPDEQLETRIDHPEMGGAV